MKIWLYEPTEDDYIQEYPSTIEQAREYEQERLSEMEGD